MDSLPSAHSTASEQERHRASSVDGENKRSSIVPPYWQRQEPTAPDKKRPRAAHRTATKTPAKTHTQLITLEDHTKEPSHKNSALWAKSVLIEDYVIVSGSMAAVGAYVVWNCQIETLEGGVMKFRKRYSEFYELRSRLLKTFPSSEAAMPQLPKKSFVAKFRPTFLEQRRIGLSYFLNCIVLNPEFSGSPVLRDFLFSS